MPKKSPKINLTELEDDIDLLCNKILSKADCFSDSSHKYVNKLLEKWLTQDINLNNTDCLKFVQKINYRIFKYITEYNEESASYLFSFNSDNGFSNWATSYIFEHPDLPEIFRYLLSSIKDACDQYKYFEKFYRFRSNEISKSLTSAFETKISNSESKIQTLESKSNEMFTKFSNKTQKRCEAIINHFQHETFTHIITLLGAFVAIVVIVMSVVITSSSWLNNASSASAIVAFAVPNLVTILGIVCLVSLVFSFVPKSIATSDDISTSNNSASENGLSDETRRTPDPANGLSDKKCWLGKKMATLCSYITFPRVVFVASIVVTICISFVASPIIAKKLQSEQIVHVRYIISPQDYSLFNECGETKIQFELNGITYHLVVDEFFDSHSNVLFCEKCGRIESQ